MNDTRITISRTEKEWKIVDSRLKEMGRSDFRAYIIGRISLLEKQYIDCPGCICTSIDKKKLQRQPLIGEQYYKTLNKISVKTGISVSTIVDKLIIDPLILSK